MSFHQLFEDPMYDEDGILVDEDAEWEDIKEEVTDEEIYSPYFGA